MATISQNTGREQGAMVTHRAFTWRHVTPQGAAEEVWDLCLKGQQGEHNPLRALVVFSLKNYGGEPGEGFAGWKLVSGGPFDGAGAYATLAEAIQGVDAWVRSYIRGCVAEKRIELDRLNAIVAAIDAALA